MKKLSKLTYKQLTKYDIPSCYKLCAISHAAGILANRKKSFKRGLAPRAPYSKRPFLVSCYGFKITDGILKIPLGNRRYHDVPMSKYTRRVLSDRSLTIHSFAFAIDAISICYSKEVSNIECTNVEGIDRNLCNLTVGNVQNVVQYDLSKAVDIAKNTRSVTKSFKRNDIRIRKQLYSKYGRRRKNRISQLLHHVSKTMVKRAMESKTAIAFEDIRRIRRLYQRGNSQSRTHRSRLDSWSFAEAKRQIEYKAAWEGLPIIQLSVIETRGTSQLCPRCGKKITQVDRKMRSCGVTSVRNGWTETWLRP
jgi:putative transposase